MVSWLVRDPVCDVVQRKPLGCGGRTRLRVETVDANTDPVCRFEAQHASTRAGIPSAHKPTPSRTLAPRRTEIDRPGMHAINEEPRRRNRANAEYPGNLLSGGKEDAADDDRSRRDRGNRALDECTDQGPERLSLIHISCLWDSQKVPRLGHSGPVGPA